MAPSRDGSAPGHVPPVIERPHRGRCAVVRGYVVRDRSLRWLYGRYVYGDFCDPGLRLATLAPGKAVGDRELGVRIESQSHSARTPGGGCTSRASTGGCTASGPGSGG